MTSFSVVVVGGGPAGSATALQLAHAGLSVLILERSHYGEWRVGETLPPAVRIPLSALGVLDRFLETNPSPSQAIWAAWGHPELYENHFIADPHGTGWHLNRQQFDALLAQAAEAAGATLLRDTQLITVEPENNGWRILAKSNGRPIPIEAAFLVDATGRSARVARTMGSTMLAYDQLIGLVGILVPKSPAETIEPVLLLEASEHGWWYTGPLPDQRIVSAYMTDSDVLQTSGASPTDHWLRQLACTTHTWGRVGGFRLVADVHVRKANSSRLNNVIGPTWIAVGDAASAYDPLAGNGVMKALESGAAAAQSITGYFEGNHRALEEYAVRLTRSFDRYLQQRAEYYGREQRWPESPFWHRRQAIDPWQVALESVS